MRSPVGACFAQLATPELEAAAVRFHPRLPQGLPRGNPVWCSLACTRPQMGPTGSIVDGPTLCSDSRQTNGKVAGRQQADFSHTLVGGLPEAALFEDRSGRRPGVGHRSGAQKTAKCLCCGASKGKERQVGREVGGRGD